MEVSAFIFVSILSLVAAEPPIKAPYLPSGWRPQGPSFELPTEILKTVEVPEQINLEVEAEGSDSFREYGPPKVDSEDILQDITIQSLPNEEPAQEFITTQQEVENTEERHHTAGHEIEAEDDTVVVQAEEQRGQIKAVVTQQEEISSIQKAEQQLSQSVQTNVEKFEQTLVNLEKQVSNQAQASVSAGVSQDAAELKTMSAANAQNEFSTGHVPLGFVEYGPPNLQEYGPPKRARVSEAEAIESVTAETTTQSVSEEVPNIPVRTEASVAAGFPELLYSTSEARRRRFSPRLVRNTQPALYAFNNRGKLVKLQ